MVKRTIRVALLLCDTPAPVIVQESGTYHDIYKRWLLQSLASYPDAEVAENTQVVVESFDVVDKREYPSQDSFNHGQEGSYDCLMLTGSRHSAYDTVANPFIPPLIDFVNNIATSPSTQHIKVVGVCFGHQIISIALGGECVPGPKGWEIGVYGCQLTKEGRYWWTGDVEGQGGDDKVYLEQMHRDHVPALPPNCQLLLSSDRYPVHSMVKLHPSSTPQQPLAQILTVQGHPEFTPSIVSHIIDMRASTGLFNSEVEAEARRRVGGKHGTGGEGFGRIGWAVWRVLLQDLPPSQEQ